MSKKSSVCAWVLALATVALAGELDIEIGNGSRVRGATRSPVTFRMALPAATRITARLKLDRGAKSPDRNPLTAELSDAATNRVARGTQAPRRRVLTIRGTSKTSGTHTLAIRPGAGAEVGFDLRLSLREPRRVRVREALTDGVAAVAFGASPGSRFDVSVSKGATIERVRTVDGSRVLYDRGAADPARRIGNLIAPGFHAAFVAECVGTGDMDISCSVRVRRGARVRGIVDLTAGTILPTSPDAVTGSIVRPLEGGTVAAPLGSQRIAGASISIPPGALTAPFSIYVGEGPELRVDDRGALTPTGPTVAFGPPDTTFRHPATAVVPFDAAAYDGDYSDFRLFLVSADGTVTEYLEDDVTIDPAAGTVSFPVSHFSAARPFVARQITLVPESAEPWEGVGTVVAFDGSRLVVGADGEDDNDAWRLRDRLGAAHVFELEGDAWTEVQRIASPIDTLRLGFGSVLALSGDTIACGEPTENPRFAGFGGSVTVFERADGAFSRVSTLVAESPFAGDGFGAAVALDGGVLAITADERRTLEYGDFGQPTTGAVEVFERLSGAWTRTAVLRGEVDEQPGFGQALALRAGRLFVGTPDGTSGVVRVYRDLGDGWTLIATLQPPDIETESGFGASLAADDARLVVFGGGAAHVYSIDAGDTFPRTQIARPFADGAPAPTTRGAIEGDRMVLVGAAPVEFRRSPGEAALFVLDRDPVSGLYEQRGVIVASREGPVLRARPVVSGGRIASPAAGAALIFEEVDPEDAP